MCEEEKGPELPGGPVATPLCGGSKGMDGDGRF